MISCRLLIALWASAWIVLLLVFFARSADWSTGEVTYKDIRAFKRSMSAAALGATVLTALVALWSWTL